jgi:hypothetical protein
MLEVGDTLFDLEAVFLERLGGKEMQRLVFIGFVCLP